MIGKRNHGKKEIMETKWTPRCLVWCLPRLTCWHADINKQLISLQISSWRMIFCISLLFEDFLKIVWRFTAVHTAFFDISTSQLQSKSIHGAPNVRRSSWASVGKASRRASFGCGNTITLWNTKFEIQMIKSLYFLKFLNLKICE